MAELDVEPRLAPDILDHVSTLEEESSSKDDKVEKVLDRMDAKVRDKIACLEHDTLGSKDEMIEDLGVVHKRAVTFSNESVIEDLNQELRRLEEENQLSRGSFNESRYPVYNVLQENTLKEVVGNMLDLVNQEEDPRLELLAELRALKAQMQVAHDIHARLESETVALRQEKEDETRVLSSQIMILKGQIHLFEEEHVSVLIKSKDLIVDLETVDDEKIKLKDKVVTLLEDRQKFEDELVGKLKTYQEQVRTMEVEQQNLLSTIEKSNAVVRRLEGLNAAMSCEFELRRHFAEGDVANLASELQISQDRQHDLRLQLQDLREENAQVAMKPSNLDQEVDEMKSDMLRLSSDLERLVQDRERKEELEAELRACKERVQSVEAEKSVSLTLVENLISQVRELEEDKRHLSGLSNDASQLVQHLWEENTRLIEGYNRLEQEKQAHERERIELVAGFQTVWVQLHVANEREALLAYDLRGLNERRDAEEVLFDQKIRDLELKLEALEQEKFDLISKSDEIIRVLEVLVQENSERTQDLQEKRDQLVLEVSELEKQNVATKQVVSLQQISWEMQVQGLESEKSIILSTVEELELQIRTSAEEVQDLKEKDLKSNLLVLELREEITRLCGEIDKLEEVKERQEGERLELAADLQAAWDQIQAVRDSEATIATELSEHKELRNVEKLRSDEFIQDLRRQLEEREERAFEAEIKVDHLSKRLHELRKEQELQDENERLGAEIVMLFQEKNTILSEKTLFLEKVQTLHGRVEGLELDKIKMAFEIEELSQWLQGPAAEKKQLAAKLDEMTCLLKGLELERSQLTTSVSKLLEEKERMLKDAGKLQSIISVLEEEQAKSLSAHEDSIRQLESLEEDKRQVLRIQEDSTLLVQHLSEKIEVLEGESTRISSVHKNSLLRIQFLEEEKAVVERFLEDQILDLNQLRHVNIEHGDALYKLESQFTQMEVQLLSTQISSLQKESSSMKTLHDTLHPQLQVLETEKSQAENIIISLGEEKSQLVQSLEELELRMQGLMNRNTDVSETVSSLEAKSMTRFGEIQIMRGHLPGVDEGKENFSTLHNELHEKLQAVILEHINKALLLEDRMERAQEELQRHEQRVESLWTVHQDTLHQLQALVEEKVKLTKALDALNLSVQKMQEENVEHITKVEFLDGELERRLSETEKCQEIPQLYILEVENAKLFESLVASNLSVYESQVKTVEHTNRLKIVEEEVAPRPAKLQRFEENAGSQSSGHQVSLFIHEVLKEGKDELKISLEGLSLSSQELHVKNRQHMSKTEILEDKMLLRQAKVQRVVEHTEGLSTVKQTTFLRALAKETDLLAKVPNDSNLSVQKFQTTISEHSTSIDSPEVEIKRRQAGMQGIGKEMKCLSTTHQDTLPRLQILEQEKVELLKCFDASCSSFQELRCRDVEISERVKFLDEEVAQRHSDVQSPELEIESLSTAHDNFLLRLQQLAAEKSATNNQFHKFQGLIKKLHTENSALVAGVELFRQQQKIEFLDSPVYSLDDKDFREASEYHGVPFREHSLEGVAEVARSIEGRTELVEQVMDGDTYMTLKCSMPELEVKTLEMENMELSTAVSKLEKYFYDASQICRDQFQSLDVGGERSGPERTAKRFCSEQKNPELAKALEDSAVADVQIVVDYLKASVLDLGRGEDKLTNELKLVQKQTCVVAERDQLSSEMQVVRDQLQECMERLQESENVAKSSKDEAVALGNEFENFREQVSKQVECTLMRNVDPVTELELVLDGQVDISHLTKANIDPRDELQQAVLGWVEIMSTICQELASLLRIVGEEKEKLARKQVISHQKTVLTEKTESFAEELSFLKQKLVNFQVERFPPGSNPDFNFGNYHQLPILVAREEQDFILGLETACQTLQSTQAERTELEAHVANLSSSLADSQGQLKALVIKSSSRNPYLLTSRADDCGHRKGLACFSVDDNGVLNSGSEPNVGRNIKALDQEKKERIGNAKVSSFTQRTQTSGRSFKKCKVNTQQPKRRWIF